MHVGKLVFAQLMEHLPWKSFGRIVSRYGGDHRVRGFSCANQFRCMAFAQLTYRESLRDIEACLRAQQAKLYHLGIRGAVARSTLADANESRDWRIYADFAQLVIAAARRLYADQPGILALEETVYALDSSTIKLCFNLFPWAAVSTDQAEVKLHTLLDLRGAIPSFVLVSEGRWHDVNVLDMLLPEPGAFYVLDRGYVAYEPLHRFHQAGAFFVIRARRNLQFRRQYSRPVDRRTGLICDQTGVLTTTHSQLRYPTPLRRVRFLTTDGKTMVLLTNHATLPALTVCEIYRCRWQIELFFKWVKQHLRIKAFFGTSENAVKTQIWIAVTVYVLVAIVKQRLKSSATLYETLQILSLTMFETTPLNQLLDFAAPAAPDHTSSNQLNLFES